MVYWAANRRIFGTCSVVLLYFIEESDEALTNNCGDIIAAHESFLAGINKIKNIIVIGHSLAPVDGDYFSEVASRLPDIKGIQWYFGCHGLCDLKCLE